MKCSLNLLLISTLMLSASAVTAADRPSLLDERFESRSNGIAFRAPAGWEQSSRGRERNEVVTYVDQPNDWVLKVSRITLNQFRPLLTDRGPDGEERAGMLDLALQEFKANHPAADVLRHDWVNIRDADVGMLALRYTLGTRRLLTQQALIQVGERHYFVLELTIPTTTPRGVEPEDVDSVDADELRAVELFRQVLDSVELLDQTAIREDQVARLFRTRALFVNLTEIRLTGALIPEQWFRVMRDGEDIGYSYVVEEADIIRETEHNPAHDGVWIGIRSRVYPEPGRQVDSASWKFVSLNRRHETWSNVSVFDQNDERWQFSELGSSDRQVRRVVDRHLERGTTIDPNQPPVREAETYSLSVSQTTRQSTGQPLEMELPPFYIPQAVGHLLPRLLPLHDPKTYLFASYVTEQRSVMMRYVDVEPERRVRFAGREFRAIPVHDRIGLEGAVTIHYMSPEGEYLGSINEMTGIMLVPTDAETLQEIWDDPELTRPDPIEQSPGRD